MANRYESELLAAIKANEGEWSVRLRQCGRRVITAVTFREVANSTFQKTGTVLLSVIGYYYSMFHAATAALYFDYCTKPEELENLKHQKLRQLIQERMVNTNLLDRSVLEMLKTLQDLREGANYQFGGKMLIDNVDYLTVVPRLYAETQQSFESCINYVRYASEFVDEGFKSQRALGSWIDDGIGPDAFRNYLSKDDEALVEAYLRKFEFHA